MAIWRVLFLHRSNDLSQPVQSLSTDHHQIWGLVSDRLEWISLILEIFLGLQFKNLTTIIKINQIKNVETNIPVPFFISNFFFGWNKFSKLTSISTFYSTQIESFSWSKCIWMCAALFPMSIAVSLLQHIIHVSKVIISNIFLKSPAYQV